MKELLICLILITVAISISVWLEARPLFVGNNASYVYSDINYMDMDDFDNDGDLDLVVSTDNDRFGIVFTNNEGTLSRVYESESGYNLYDVAVVELNGDEYPDIVGNIFDSYESNDYIQVFINNGDSTFTATDRYLAVNDGGSIAVLDVDGDLDDDVVHTSTTYLSVFINNGDGTLNDRIEYDCGPNWSYEPAVADFDGDGDLDLAVPNYGYDTLRVMINDGSGGFDSLVNYPTGDNPFYSVAAKINNDDYIDVVTACFGNGVGAITIHINNGDGTFADSVTIDLPTRAYCLEAADIDDDGDNDLIVAQWTEDDNGLLVLRNDGDGAFAAPENYYSEYPHAIRAYDFDQDGDLDLAVGGWGAYVELKYNDGTGDFSGPERYITSNRSIAVECGDINGDTYPDVVVGNQLSRNVSVFMNNGDSTLAAPAGWSMGSGLAALALVDLDGQHGLDMVTANYDADSVTIQFNNGSGSFSGAPYSYLIGNGPNDLVAADFNDDNYFDLATANSLSNDLTILYNNGDGTFPAAVSIPAAGSEPKYLMAIDIDGDDDQDIVYFWRGTWQYPGGLAILINDGAGSFTDGGIIDSPDYIFALAAYDINGDNIEDILATANSSLYIYFSNGDGSLSDPDSVYLGTDPSAIIAGDYNLDGDLDLAFANESYGFITILYNYGNGDFMEPVFYVVNEYNRDIAQTDLDGDGDLELVSITTTSEIDDMVVFWNLKDQIPVDVDGDGQTLMPMLYTLSQNYPNPFNPFTSIDYAVPSRCRVTIMVYNILGQPVRQLVDEYKSAGIYTAYWDGCDENRQTMASGLYFYRIKAGDYAETRKMVLLK